MYVPLICVPDLRSETTEDHAEHRRVDIDLRGVNCTRWRSAPSHGALLLRPLSPGSSPCPDEIEWPPKLRRRSDGCSLLSSQASEIMTLRKFFMTVPTG